MDGVGSVCRPFVKFDRLRGTTVATAAGFAGNFANPPFSDQLSEHPPQGVGIHFQGMFELGEGGAAVGFEMVLELGEYHFWGCEVCSVGCGGVNLETGFLSESFGGI